MNSLAASHLGLALSLAGLSLLGEGPYLVVNIAVAVFFALLSVAVLLRNRLPKSLAEAALQVRIWPLALFLGFVALGLGIHQREWEWQGWVLIGIACYFVGYTFLAFGIGWSFGSAFRTVRISDALRFLRGFLLGLVWAPVFWTIHNELPEYTPPHIIRSLAFAPLRLFRLATDKDERQDFRQIVKGIDRFLIHEQAASSSEIQRYESGEYANCNCLGCRLAKASIRRWLTKYYLLAYCLKCRKQVTIENPTEVMFKNGSVAIGGVCHICGVKVFRTGKFYGKTLFDR